MRVAIVGVHIIISNYSPVSGDVSYVKLKTEIYKVLWERWRQFSIAVSYWVVL